MALLFISESECLALTTRYQEYINDVGFTNSIAEIFRLDPGTGSDHFLGGFSIQLSDFVHLISYVGVTQFTVKFGLESRANQIPGQPQFVLLVQGRNAAGTIVGPCVKLEHAFEASAKTKWPSIERHFRLAVPIAAIKQWIANWKKLTKPVNIELPPYFCMISLLSEGRRSTEVLRGYTFALEDFLGVLYQDIDRGFHLTDPNSLVNFYTLNHNHHAAGSRYSGILGLAVCGVQRDDETGEETGEETFNVVNGFFDFSSPCPPTCPQVQ